MGLLEPQSERANRFLVGLVIASALIVALSGSLFADIVHAHRTAEPLRQRTNAGRAIRVFRARACLHRREEANSTVKKVP